MFGRMTGRQLAGWGYGLFWIGLLVELVNAFHGAMSAKNGMTPSLWIGAGIAFAFVVLGLSMLSLIRHRPW